MKKLIVSGALALAFSTSAVVAEESGAFVGVDLGLANLSKMTSESNGGTQTTYALGSLRYGLMGGYKWFFTENVGLRAYVALNNGTSYLQDASTQTPNGNQFNSMFVNANVDFLNTFYNSEQVSAGWFAGLSLGVGIHSGGIVKATTANSNLSNISGFDMGINLGLRTLFGKKHGIEFFTRFGVIGASATAEINGTPIKTDMSTTQIYNTGVRYTYNF